MAGMKKTKEILFPLQSPVPEVVLPSNAMTENGKRAISPEITCSVATFSFFLPLDYRNNMNSYNCKAGAQQIR